MLAERELRFLRVHGLTAGLNLPPVHIGFGCMPGKLRVMTTIPVPKADPTP